MKFCPKCQTKYDEEIIRFCTKDGAPLVDENPSFTAMPSQSFSDDDVGEETIITRNRPVVPPPIPPLEEPSQRVVINIGEEKKQEVRPLENPQRSLPPPRKSNTALVVLLTIFGTIALLAGGIGVWLLLGSSSSSVANTTANVNVNNSNVAVNYNSTIPDFGINANTNVNSNTNTNLNTNINTNANSKPSPTKTPTPKPSPNANANVNANANTNVNMNTTVIIISPSNSNSSNRPPTPQSTPNNSATPKPSPTATKTPPSNVNIGVMNSRAKQLRKPAYPPIAKQMGASGQVVVQISIDEDGNVVAAKAVSGHQLLRVPAEAAARQSSFNPVRVGDKAIRANGTIVYNFINQ
jgi:TonB family protein